MARQFQAMALVARNEHGVVGANLFEPDPRGDLASDGVGRLATVLFKDGRTVHAVGAHAVQAVAQRFVVARRGCVTGAAEEQRSEEHTSELQSLMRISYAVFCLNKKKKTARQEISKRQHKTY